MIRGLLVLGAVAGAAVTGVDPGGPVLPGPRVHLAAATTGATPRFSLPVPDGTVTEAALRAPHHDYPASDLMVPSGTPVFSAHDGRTRTHAGDRCGLGVTVIAEAGHRTVYCHLSRVSVGGGTDVRAGDVLGLSGDTGNAVGVPHLHFHLRDTAGRYQCPQPHLVAWSRGLDREPTQGPVYTGCSFVRGGS